MLSTDWASEKQQVSAMTTNGMVTIWVVLLLCPVIHSQGKRDVCKCTRAKVLDVFPPSLPVEACCLNYSGSAFGQVRWEAFSLLRNLQILDLSHCNISQLDHGHDWGSPPLLRRLYLGHNCLSALPQDFLANASSLQVLDLRRNKLEELPEGFLQGSDELQELDLSGNLLTAVPSSLLLGRHWQRLELSPNPWACTCSLAEELHGDGSHNGTLGDWRRRGVGRWLEELLGNLTCASPWNLAGQSLWSVQRTDVCHPPGLTALFILLPLLVLALLVLCWCCGRKRKRKETPAFGAAGKKASARPGHHLSDCNGRWHHAKPSPGGGELAAPREGSKEGIMKNQLMLRPSSALLGSTRDIYEEVEIRLGSVESLGRPPSSLLSVERQPQQPPDAPELRGSKPDLETVSVTEVMKDSANREKAYLTQSTEYYSLVPAIEIDDSDHGEYESVDLS